MHDDADDVSLGAPITHKPWSYRDGTHDNVDSGICGVCVFLGTALANHICACLPVSRPRLVSANSVSVLAIDPSTSSFSMYLR
jgi:hypothetical protein